jgi:hypothetical protein
VSIDRKKGSRVHVATACTGSEEGSNHFGSNVRNISLHFCKRLFSKTWTHDLMVTREQLYRYARSPLHWLEILIKLPEVGWLIKWIQLRRWPFLSCRVTLYLIPPPIQAMLTCISGTYHGTNVSTTMFSLNQKITKWFVWHPLRGYQWHITHMLSFLYFFGIVTKLIHTDYIDISKQKEGNLLRIIL